MGKVKSCRELGHHHHYIYRSVMMMVEWVSGRGSDRFSWVSIASRFSCFSPWGGFLRIRTFPVSGLRSVCTLRGCGGGEEYCLVLEVVGVYVGVVIGSVGFIREGVVVVGNISLIHEGVVVAIGFLQEGVVLGVVV